MLLWQEQEQRREARTQGRCRFDSAEVEGRVAGARAGEAVGEARAQGRCRVTVGMVV